MRRNRDLHKGVSEFKETLKETSRAQTELCGLTKKVNDIALSLESTAKFCDNRLNTVEEVVKKITYDSSSESKQKELEERMLKNYEQLRAELDELREYYEIDIEAKGTELTKKTDEELNNFEDFVKAELDKVVIELKGDFQLQVDLKTEVEQLKNEIKELKTHQRGRPRECADTEKECPKPATTRTYSSTRVKNIEQLSNKV